MIQLRNITHYAVNKVNFELERGKWLFAQITIFQAIRKLPAYTIEKKDDLVIVIVFRVFVKLENAMKKVFSMNHSCLGLYALKEKLNE